MDPTVSSPVFQSSSWINSTACQNPVSERPCSKGLWSRLFFFFFTKATASNHDMQSSGAATAPLLELLGVPSLPQLLFQKLAIFVFKCFYDKTSPLFNNLFVPINDPATPQLRTTRGQVSSLLRVPFLPSSAGRRSIQFVGNILWNALPVAVRTEGDWRTFK